jgi:hypothetical protein
MGNHPAELHACFMQRTRRQTTLVGNVRVAMSKRDARHMGSSRRVPAPRRSRHVESEQMARWENEGGAVRHSADRRPRPLP